jgi:hypothetical protein
MLELGYDETMVVEGELESNRAAVTPAPIPNSNDVLAGF